MIRKIHDFRYFSLLLFITAVLLYSSNISGVSIYILDEAKNAGCAREMFERGDLIVPTFNQELRTDKPPLHYFFMMLSYSLFGENAFAARFFSALFGALTTLITYRFARKYAGVETAFWTAAVLLASVHLSIQFHLAVPDPYLIFFFTTGVMSFYAAVKERKPLYLLLMYIAIGFGTLAKGPVAIGLPGLIFLLFLIFSKRFSWKEIRALKPLWGAALVLVIALPWYILVHLKTNGAWTDGFFLKHNLGRFTDEMEGHGGIFLLTIVFVLIGLFPFSAFVVQAAKQAWKNRKDDFTRFNLVAGVTIVAFFSVSRTKLPNYTVPAYPFLAMMLAQYLSTIRMNQPKSNISLLLLLSFSFILAPGIFLALKLDPALSHVNHIAWYFLPFPAIMMAAFFLWKKKKPEPALWLVTAGGMATAILFFTLAFPVIDRQNPVAKSQHLLDGKEVRYFEKFNPAFGFALQEEIPPIQPDEFQSFFQQYPNGVIISTRNKLDQIELPEDLEVSFSARDILETPTSVLITRKP
ncbi:MAG: ArnT family glycosyltransferase [Mangrovibacterium sp.]